MRAILPRIRELNKGYSELDDKTLEDKLRKLPREASAYNRMFSFDATNCTLSPFGRQVAEDVVAGRPTAVVERVSGARPSLPREPREPREPRDPAAPREPAAPAAPAPPKASKVMLDAMDAAKLEAAAQAKPYTRPTEPGDGVAACHQCAMLTLKSGRTCRCGLTFCEECMDSCYPSIKPETLVDLCPKCIDVCICTVRLRRGLARSAAAD